MVANSLDIHSAEIVRNESATDASNLATGVHIEGGLDGDEYDDEYFSVFIRAKEVLIRLSISGNTQSADSTLLSMEEFIELGKQYWQAWGAQTLKDQIPTTAVVKVPADATY